MRELGEVGEVTGKEKGGPAMEGITGGGGERARVVVCRWGLRPEERRAHRGEGVEGERKGSGWGSLEEVGSGLQGEWDPGGERAWCAFVCAAPMG